MIRARAFALVCMSGLLGCEPEPPAEPPITLAAASEKITFGTVEQLGPHLARASITRIDSRDGAQVSTHVEVSEIRWQDWDHFQYRRLLDDKSAIVVLVIAGRAWARQGEGPWQQRKDPEPFRVQLRTTWNAWDQALEVFGERVNLTEVGLEEVDGRPTRRFEVSLTPIPEGSKARKRAFEPISLSGLAWIDEATAIHLTAHVEGEVTQGNLTRRIELKIARSEFGENLGLEPPTETAQPRVEPEAVPRPAGITP